MFSPKTDYFGYLYEKINENDTHSIPGVLNVCCRSHVMKDDENIGVCEYTSQITATTLLWLVLYENPSHVFVDKNMDLCFTCEFCAKKITIHYESWVKCVISFLMYLHGEKPDLNELLDVFGPSYSDVNHLTLDMLEILWRNYEDYMVENEQTNLEETYKDIYRHERFRSWNLNAKNSDQKRLYGVFTDGELKYTPVFILRYNPIKGDQKEFETLSDKRKSKFLQNKIKVRINTSFDRSRFNMKYLVSNNPKEMWYPDNDNYASVLEDCKKLAEDREEKNRYTSMGLGPIGMYVNIGFLFKKKRDPSKPFIIGNRIITKFNDNERTIINNCFKGKSINRKILDDIVKSKIIQYCEIHPNYEEKGKLIVSQIFDYVSKKLKYGEISEFFTSYRSIVFCKQNEPFNEHYTNHIHPIMMAANKTVESVVEEVENTEVKEKEKEKEVEEVENTEVKEKEIEKVEVKEKEVEKTKKECPKISFRFSKFADYCDKVPNITPGTSSKILNTTYKDLCDEIRKFINNNTILDIDTLRKIAEESYDENYQKYFVNIDKVFQNLCSVIGDNEHIAQINDLYYYLILKHIFTDAMQEDLYAYLETIFQEELAGKITGTIYEGLKEIFLDLNFNKANSIIERNIEEAYARLQ